MASFSRKSLNWIKSYVGNLEVTGTWSWGKTEDNTPNCSWILELSDSSPHRGTVDFATTPCLLFLSKLRECTFAADTCASLLQTFEIRHTLFCLRDCITNPGIIGSPDFTTTLCWGVTELVSSLRWGTTDFAILSCCGTTDLATALSWDTTEFDTTPCCDNTESITNPGWGNEDFDTTAEFVTTPGWHTEDVDTTTEFVITPHCDTEDFDTTSDFATTWGWDTENFDTTADFATTPDWGTTESDTTPSLPRLSAPDIAVPPCKDRADFATTPGWGTTEFATTPRCATIDFAITFHWETTKFEAFSCTLAKRISGRFTSAIGCTELCWNDDSLVAVEPLLQGSPA